MVSLCLNIVSSPEEIVLVDPKPAEGRAHSAFLIWQYEGVLS
jgi:hypothetical protein